MWSIAVPMNSFAVIVFLFFFHRLDPGCTFKNIYLQLKQYGTGLRQTGVAAIVGLKEDVQKGRETVNGSQC